MFLFSVGKAGPKSGLSDFLRLLLVLLLAVVIVKSLPANQFPVR